MGFELNLGFRSIKLVYLSALRAYEEEVVVAGFGGR